MAAGRLSRWGGRGVGAAALAWLAMGPVQAALPNGVAAGDVTQGTAVLWARTDAPGDVAFDLWAMPSFLPAPGATVSVSDPTRPAKVPVSGLAPGTRYLYRATDAGGASAFGVFRTAASLGGRMGLRFGVSGDWRGELGPYPAVKNAIRPFPWSRPLDFFVALGDTIYADYPSPAVPKPQAEDLADYRAKHGEVYSASFGLNALGDLRASTAVYATIDDHEVTNDFAGAADVATDPRFAADPPGTLINDSTLFETGLQAFFEYNPLADETYPDTGADPRMDGEGRLYRYRTFGSDAAMFLLDSRSFRDEPLPAVANPLDFGELWTYRVTSLLADRTMLGRRQLDDLKADLTAAQDAGVTWKFVFVPEPIQSLGVVNASDRFEGYARERTELLKHIADQGIKNVVFVAADIHGTLINNLSYQTLDGLKLTNVPVPAFEVTTGAVAFDAPFGPTVLELADTVEVAPGLTLQDALLQVLGLPDLQAFAALPRSVKDLVMQVLIDILLGLEGQSPVGLQDSGLDVTLLRGGYASLHTFGWTEFEIDPQTQALKVTTWGIDPYTAADVAADPAGVAARRPAVVSQFEVRPAP